MSPVSPVFHTEVTVNFIHGTRAVEAQFQTEAPDPYSLFKRRTDLGALVVLSTFDSITFMITIISRFLTGQKGLCLYANSLNWFSYRKNMRLCP